MGVSRTKKFIDHQKQILLLAAQLAPHLNTTRLITNAKETRTLLSKFLGLLNIHLAMADKSLYPYFLQHNDQRIRETAKRFIAEMGGIATFVKGYSKQWATQVAIQSNPERFIRETEQLLDELKERFEKERTELYPLDISDEE